MEKSPTTAAWLASPHEK